MIQMEQDMTPFGIIDNGNSEDFEVDSEGQAWYSAEDDNPSKYGFI
jgi:hypothetical protein